jgi:FkbM family methyltransferase
MNWLSSCIHGLLDRTPYRLIHERNLARLKKTASYRPSSDALAEHLRQVFARAGICCVFDVGANDGTYARFLREQVKFDGLIISFEPQTMKLRDLERAAKNDNQWIIMPCALGATPGRATINLMRGDAFSSFRAPSHDHIQKYEEANVIVATEEVPVRTLADVYSEIASQHGISRFYLKMDTQGFDLEVFRGALPVLQHVPALQSELSFVPIYQGAPSASEAQALFAEHGFDPSLTVPVGFDESLRVIEADCVMVHPTRMLSASRPSS